MLAAPIAVLPDDRARPTRHRTSPPVLDLADLHRRCFDQDTRIEQVSTLDYARSAPEVTLVIWVPGSSLAAYLLPQ
jgi:hypothetical protein